MNKAIDKFFKHAKAHTDKNCLLVISLASHGYSYDGNQAVLSPFYDAVSDELQLIEIEKIVRGKA